MGIKHEDLLIESGKPFENCKLDRKKYADVLTSIVSNYSEGFVLAINNKWGAGNTTFIKMWEQDLKDKEYQTVFFNAWENDFENNPLIALMGELKTLTDGKVSTEQKFKNVLQNASVLSKHLLPVVAKSILDKYIDTEEIKDAVLNATKGVAEIFENDVKEYTNKKKSIGEFRSSLSKFIADTNDGKPLIFIIDELDRCRPDYAVSILEQIKHFFTVPNIVFVLSIDKTQLGNAVRGVYGSESIDADEYLRRFIDVEYSIPPPNEKQFYEYLFSYFKFEDFFIKRQYGELQYDENGFLAICDVLLSDSNISLRQQEKIFVNARLALRTFSERNYMIPYVFLYLNLLKVVNEQFYNEIKNKSLSLNQFQARFFDTVKAKKNPDNIEELMWLEGYLVVYYNNYLYDSKNQKLYRADPANINQNQLLIDSIVDDEKNNQFLGILENIYKVRSGNLNIKYFFNKIDLLENISL